MHTNKNRAENWRTWLDTHGYIDKQPLYVFGYGSLMWHPGFSFRSQYPVFVSGYHRRFCVRSNNYRGTPQQPGLVLGLDRGGNCHGMIFEIAPPDIAKSCAYLWDREMSGTDIYHPVLIPMLHHEKPLQALAFIVNPQSPDYYPDNNPDRIADIITHSTGNRGTNLSYLEETVNALALLQISDHGLNDLLRRCQILRARQSLTSGPISDQIAD